MTINLIMSDLSNLLGDVYGHGPDRPDPSPRGEGPTVPDWADDRRLDEAFADWEPEARYPLQDPGPPGAPPETGFDDELTAALAAALSERPAAAAWPSGPAEPPAPAATPPAPPPAYRPAPPAAATAPAPAPAYRPAPPAAATPPAPAPAVPPPPATSAHAAWNVPVHPLATPLASWTRGDDDILPAAKGAKKPKKR